MAKTTDQIKQIVNLGGGVSIDADSKTTDQLKQIAALAVKSGATIILKNSDSKTTSQLKQIAELAPGKVIFEL
ncbi:MAG: hypothetical protein N4A35_01720 [Flavobacteriales bacterium]|jgi:hypothetical protein|nr:hypothetical protein [Flavobacteriales bacterium]